MLASLCIGLVDAQSNSEQELVLSEFVRVDPDKVVGPERCGECHFSEHQVWSQTPHATGFDTLHRKESAQEIAANMGFRLIKRVSLCLKCHYTPMIQRGQLRAVEGVSCESCHGAATDWVNVHSNYGVQERDFRVARTLETPEHKVQRIARARNNGMRRPSDLYGVAANCYECHTVPHEQLVNVGGHSTGSAGFELVEWSQGKIRHNFLESFLTGDGKTNAERPPERKRVMYVVGKALELEYLLRGVAAATEKGKYLNALVRRKRRAIGALREINDAAILPEVDRMLTAVNSVELKPNNEAALFQAAETIREQTTDFIASHDGSMLAALDPLYTRAAAEERVADRERGTSGRPPTAEVAPGEPEEPRREGSPASKQQTPETDRQARPAPAEQRAPAGASETRQGTEAEAPAGRQSGLPAGGPVGEIRTWPPWRPLPEHDTLREIPCTSCHEHDAQVNWWYEDKHAGSADPLLDEDPKYATIATGYGISASEMTRGNQICMQCHGTYPTGREGRTVNDGVGCQRCHGPGADFKDIHQEDYGRGLQLGMVPLKDLSARARVCAGCHYVTEPRLISVGHPTGSDFDFAAGNAAIKHWEAASAPEQLRAAFAAVVAERGPLPSVRVVAVSPEAQPPAADTGPATRATEPGQARDSSTPAPVTDRGVETPAAPPPATTTGTPTRPPTSEADRPTGVSTAAPPADPEGSSPTLGIDENATVEEILLLVKERLDRLYRLLRERQPR